MKAADVLDRVEKLRQDGRTLKSAIDAVSCDTGVSVHALREAYHRPYPRNPSAHGDATLGAEKDATLVALAQAFIMNNMPLSNMQVRQLVQRKWGKELSASWLRRWVKRHKKELSRRACKALSDKRAGPSVMQSVEDFSLELKELLKQHHFTPGGTMNYDESRIVNEGGRMVTQRVESADKERANALSVHHSTVASLLSFVAADGTVFLSVYVMKAKFEDDQAAEVNFKLHAAPRTGRRDWPRYYCCTESGFLDADAFAHVVDLVATEWSVRNPSTDLLLVGDRLWAHMRPATLGKALDRQVCLFFLLPNTSHFLQPLDASPFATFHNLVRRSNEQQVMDGMLVNIETGEALLALAFYRRAAGIPPPHCARVVCDHGPVPV
eukprot:contig_13107_g3117